MFIICIVFEHYVLTMGAHVFWSYKDLAWRISHTKNIHFINDERLTRAVITMRCFDEEETVHIWEFNQRIFLFSCVIESFTIIKVKLSFSKLTILSDVNVKHEIILECLQGTESPYVFPGNNRPSFNKCTDFLCFHFDGPNVGSGDHSFTGVEIVPIDWWREVHLGLSQVRIGRGYQEWITKHIICIDSICRMVIGEFHK